MKILLILCIIIIATFAISDTDGSQVLLVSMDGFRWDYLQKTATPNFDLLAARGTKAQYIEPTFITKTFPSHYTIVTGLYQESHGIVGNVMFDPEFDAIFGMSTNEARWWQAGEPLWVTTRRQNLTSATYFWPGSEVEIRGYRPNYWKPFNSSIPFKSRVDEVTKWLADDRIDFATLYFNQPDLQGHIYGPDSPEVVQEIQYMDSILGYLIEKFDANKLWDKVNLIVTSDHGMASVDNVNIVVDISDYVNMSDISFTLDSGPTMQIFPRPGKTDVIVDGLKNVANISVYKTEDIPDVWNYNDNIRVSPILVVAAEGWSITKNKTRPPFYTSLGDHGYDNRLESMRTIFFARGPNIARNYVAKPFSHVDIYPLICKMLHIQPSPNNGSLESTRDFVIEDHTSAAVGYQSSYRVEHLLMLLLFLSLTNSILQI